MILTRLVGRIYQICFEVSLWLNLVVFTIAGGILGSAIDNELTSLGIFLGLIVGIIINVLGGGFIIKLLHLDE